MNTFKNYSFIFFTLLMISTFSFSQENVLPTKEKYDLVEMQGTITEIDKETRDITIIGSKGELHTFRASEDVERFDEIEVGEVITFDFYKYMKAEFRQPTEEEKAEPLVIVAEAGKAGMDTEPGAAIGAVFKAVVTIQAINLQFMFVSIQGPNGNYTTIQMEDEELIKKLHVGQIVILTYGEAIAVKLTKVED